MIELFIGRTDSEYMNIQITGRCPYGRGYFGGIYLNAEIEISVFSFRGEISVNLSANDLSKFSTDLARLYSFDSHECIFKACNGDVSVKINGDGLGNFTANCEATDWRGNILSFRLFFDQTQIPEMIRKLSEVNRRYCVL